MSRSGSASEASTSTTTIRRGDLSDAGELHAVGIEVTAATYGPIHEEYALRTVREQWSIETLRASLERYDYWVAVDENGAILGVVNLGEFDGEWVFGKLYVRPMARGRGVGTQLLAAASAAADGSGLSLEYVDGNRSAEAFCHAHGFAEVRRTASAEGLPDMVLMRRAHE